MKKMYIRYRKMMRMDGIVMTEKNDYIIFTDSGCDMSAEQLSEWDVPYRCLSFRFDGDDIEYSNKEKMKLLNIS